MARAVLIVATVVDLALAALLIGVSGFVFGAGPEGMSGTPTVAAGWTAILAFCVIAPGIGFFLSTQRRPVGGILVAWLPPVIAAVMAALPPGY
jgi:hypothetical protein